MRNKVELESQKSHAHESAEDALSLLDIRWCIKIAIEFSQGAPVLLDSDRINLMERVVVFMNEKCASDELLSHEMRIQSTRTPPAVVMTEDNDVLLIPPNKDLFYPNRVFTRSKLQDLLYRPSLDRPEEEYIIRSALANLSFNIRMIAKASICLKQSFSSQQFLLDRMIVCGYPSLTQYGVCSGLSSMAMQAFLADNLRLDGYNMRRFTELLYIIQNTPVDMCELIDSTPFFNLKLAASREIDTFKRAGTWANIVDM